MVGLEALGDKCCFDSPGSPTRARGALPWCQGVTPKTFRGQPRAPRVHSLPATAG